MISEFPLFVFTLLGGMGAGVYVFTPFVSARKPSKPWLLPVLVLVLLAISGVAVLTHLGRPDLVLNAFRNPKSGITLEGFTTIVFGILVVIDFALGLAKKQFVTVKVFAAVAGVLLLFAMGYAYASYVTSAVWGVWQTYFLFVCGGLALGGALAAFFVENGYKNNTLAIAEAVSLALSIIGAILVGIVFAENGHSIVPFVLGAVLLVIALGILLWAKEKNGSIFVVMCVFAIALAGVVVARYFFYAAA